MSRFLWRQYYATLSKSSSPRTAHVSPTHEFAIIIGNPKDCADIKRRIAAITKALAEPYHVHGQKVYVTASIGTARFPEGANTAAGLLDPRDTQSLIAQFGTPLDQMVAEGDLSSYKVVIDPNQNILSTKIIYVDIDCVPVGIALASSKPARVRATCVMFWTRIGNPTRNTSEERSG